MRVLVCAVLLGLLVGCPKPPPLHKSKDLIESTPLQDTNPSWSAAMPSHLREVRLHAHNDCVFVTGEKSTEAATRTQLCIDPRSGDVVWAHETAVSATANRDEDVYHAATEHFVYANRKHITGLRRSDGKPAWTFEDPGGLPIYNTVGLGDQLVLSLGNRKLAVIDARSGAWIAGFALRDESLKQVITTPAGHKIALMVAVDTASDAPPKLVAVDLSAPGGADPAAQLPAARILWSTPIESWASEVSAAGDVILGALAEDEWWALDMMTGKRLWTVRKSALQSPPIFTDNAVLLHHTQTPEDQPRAGTLEMISVDPRTLPDKTARWTLTLTTGEQLLGVEELENDPRTLGATTDTLFQFDSKTGRLLWSLTLDHKQNPGQWTNASSNGEAAFLFFEIPGKPGVLKRIPIFTE